MGKRREGADASVFAFAAGRSNPESVQFSARLFVNSGKINFRHPTYHRCKPTDQVILEYDYTFTTPCCGRADRQLNLESGGGAFHWEDCQTQIDMVALASKDPILFYDEVILYEDELDDNGVSILTVKVRVMPSGWFLLLRFWLRVDGVLMRLRETRMHCTFKENTEPIILLEIRWRETTFSALSSKGYPTDAAAYSDPDVIWDRLPIIKRNTQKLAISWFGYHNYFEDT